MNKKGFTLIELIAVITLIAIVAVIATPNVVKMVDNGKKEQFITDAKELISKAKYMYKLDKYNSWFTDIGNNCYEITATLLETELDKDADNNAYDMSSSKVKICIVNNTYVYYVKTVSKKSDTELGRGVSLASGSSSYVEEKDLSKDKVVNLTSN